MSFEDKNMPNTPSNLEHLEAFESDIKELENTVVELERKVELGELALKQIKEIELIINGLHTRAEELRIQGKKLGKNIPETESEWDSYLENYDNLMSVREKIYALEEEYKKIISELEISDNK